MWSGSRPSCPRRPGLRVPMDVILVLLFERQTHFHRARQRAAGSTERQRAAGSAGARGRHLER